MWRIWYKRDATDKEGVTVTVRVMIKGRTSVKFTGRVSITVIVWVIVGVLGWVSVRLVVTGRVAVTGRVSIRLLVTGRIRVTASIRVTGKVNVRVRTCVSRLFCASNWF